MAHPHPALIEIAAGRDAGPVGDAGALCRSALEHRMSGLLFSLVRAGGLDVGAEWRDRLAREDLANRLWQRRLWAGLSLVVQRLESIGVPVATFKGVTTSARWYEREGERPCADLDVLIGPADHPRAAQIVATLQPDHPLRDILQPLVDRRALPSVDVTLPSGVAVDLHFDVLKYEVPARQNELIWERTQPFELPDGRTVRVLDRETALVHSLVHLNRDRFRHLLGYVDIARMLADRALDWAFIQRFVRGEGLEVPVYLSLEAVTGTLGIECPPHPAPGGWRAVLWRRLWPPSVRLSGALGAVRYRNRHRWLAVMARGRMREGMRSYLDYLFPPRELLDLHFPGTSGGYLRRNVTGRLRHVRERRRATARLRRDASAHPSRGAAPNSEDE